MSAEKQIRGYLEATDRSEQRAAREALKSMVKLGRISQDDLGLVATPSPSRRKSLTLLTVSDLISMGIVTVVPSG